MASIAIVFHSGYGHTQRQAQAVAEGAGAHAHLIAIDADGNLPEGAWEQLQAADAIVFGSPTYMGGASWQFKKFADASSKAWFTQAWKNKVFAGFTNSASTTGDKASTINYFTTLAMQHGGVWVGTGMMPSNSKAATRNDVNWIGAASGAMATTPSDASVAEMLPGDLETARQFGKRVAEVATKWAKYGPKPCGPCATTPRADGRRRAGIIRRMTLTAVFPWYDWLALAWFVAVWWGYAWYSRAASVRGETLLAVTNRWRRAWLVQATRRDNRVVDGTIVQTLSSSPSFFASTTIIIIGGLLALMGTTDKAAEVVRELPFAATTNMLVFELKLLLLLVIFTFAFFRFTWAIRQYTFAALVLGAMPEPAEFLDSRVDREAYADQGATLAGMAAESFNDGVRAYYFAFAAIAWFVSPLAFAVAAALVVGVLYGREFHSNVLDVLRGR